MIEGIKMIRRVTRNISRYMMIFVNFRLFHCNLKKKKVIVNNLKMKWSNFRYPSIYLTPICNMYYYICTRSINQFFRRRYIYNRMCHVAYDYYPECSCNNLTNLFLLSLRVLRLGYFYSCSTKSNI